MASAPSRLSLRIDDYPPTGLGSSDAVQKLFSNLNSFGDQVVSVLSRGITFGQNCNMEVKTVNFTTPAETVTTPTLSGTWVGTVGQLPSWRRDATGNIILEGICSGGVATSTIFTGLPVPRFAMAFPSAVTGGGVFIVKSTGNLDHSSGSTTNFWISGMYRPAVPTPGVLSCFPLKVSCGLTKVAGVLLLNLYDATGGNQIPTAVAGVHAQAVSGGYQVLNIPGLVIGRKYQATLLAVGG